MPLPDHVRLVVLFGGSSAEHEVSCTTARHVLAALDRSRYQPVPIGITRDGQWLRADDAVAALEAGHLPEALVAAGTAVEPLPTVVPVGAEMTTVVLPLLHGPKGEDGTVQGMLELAGVPYVGSGVLASALAMDKGKAKEVLAHAGIPQARWACRRSADFAADVADGPAGSGALADIAGDLGLPLFVKPANMGSSIGVSKVTTLDELGPAVALAADFDEWIVFEEFISGRELEVGVLGNERPRASVVGEIEPGAEFYDYDDKYLDGNARLLIPAPVPATVSDEVRDMALRAYRALRCDGMARVDFFWEEHGRGLLVNELNTIPGFTPASMYPKLWEASGLPYSALLDELIALALARHARRSGFRTDH